MGNFKDKLVERNEAGTPQGGIISPLLCNIALHGMETELLKNFSRNGVKIIRYADDFVVFVKKLPDVEKAKLIVTKFLASVKLELSEEKTRIGHSMTPIKEGEKPGLNFLGYYFRNIQTSIHRGVKSTRGVKQTFRQISMPSIESVQNHKREIRNLLRKYKSAPREVVIAKLASKIRG